MKKTILSIIILLMCVLPLSAQRQGKGLMWKKDSTYVFDPSRVAVKMNASTLVGLPNLALEAKMCKYATVQLECLGSFYGKNFFGTGHPFTVAAVWSEFRYYPQEAYHGFYIGMHAGFGVYRLSKSVIPLMHYPDNSNEQAFHAGQCLMVGFAGGYCFQLSKHWSMELSWSGGWQGSMYCAVNPDLSTGQRHGSTAMLYDASYLSWNGSGEWLPLYKGGILVTYKW